MSKNSLKGYRRLTGITNPAPTRIYIEPTSRCNLKCVTCLRNTWDEGEGDLPMELYERILGGFKSFPTAESVSFWGIGEPCMHPSIVEMVAKASAAGLDTDMISNGLLLDERLSRGLVEAGLDSLIISADGASEEAHGDIRPGAVLSDAEKNLSRLHAIKNETGSKNPVVGLEFVVMKRNLHQLRELPAMMERFGASFTIVTNLLPYTEAMKDEILYWISARDTFLPIEYAERSGIFLPPIDQIKDNLVHLEGLKARPLSVNSLEIPNDGRRGYCRYVNNGSFAISWNGLVSPCVGLMHSHTAYILGRKKDIRRHTVGDVSKTSLPEIWNGAGYSAFRKRVLEFQYSPCSECTGCELAEKNDQDCCGNTFPVCGDCLWARGIVICP
jgi:MoaA/NifB/PqqE/SkfB family radical SAM enzyme